jgi:hypothetical protein
LLHLSPASSAAIAAAQSRPSLTCWKNRLDSHFKCDDDIDGVIWSLNSTPRKCLAYKTPIEAFAINLGVALEM